MSKRKPTSEVGPEHPGGRTFGVESGKSVEGVVEDFAEDLGRLLGTAQSKAKGWLSQREAIVKHLESIRDMANGLLDELGHQARGVVKSGRRGYRETAAGEAKAIVNVIKRRVGKMSAAGRKAVSEAQKARWAKLRAGKK